MAKEECICGNLVDDFTSREVEALSNLRLGGYTKEDHEVLMARLNSKETEKVVWIQTEGK